MVSQPGVVDSSGGTGSQTAIHGPTKVKTELN